MRGTNYFNGALVAAGGPLTGANASHAAGICSQLVTVTKSGVLGLREMEEPVALPRIELRAQ